jgi:hypothetical protein
MVTSTAGFKQALADLGLTPDLITSALVEDINSKKERRLGELRLGAEILGMTKPENEPPQQQSGNIYNIFFKPDIQLKVKAMEDEIKKSLIQKDVQ